MRARVRKRNEMDLVTGDDEVVRDGGYDDGYRSVTNFWGPDPGSLVRLLTEAVSPEGRSVLDLGAGEGKNAYCLASLGADVEAWEVSDVAMANGRRGASPPKCSRSFVSVASPTLTRRGTSS